MPPYCNKCGDHHSHREGCDSAKVELRKQLAAKKRETVAEVYKIILKKYKNAEDTAVKISYEFLMLEIRDEFDFKEIK